MTKLQDTVENAIRERALDKATIDKLAKDLQRYKAAYTRCANSRQKLEERTDELTARIAELEQMDKGRQDAERIDAAGRQFGKDQERIRELEQTLMHYNIDELPERDRRIADLERRLAACEDRGKFPDLDSWFESLSPKASDDVLPKESGHNATPARSIDAS